MHISSITPLAFTTLDGVERKFHLTMRQQRDIARKFGIELAAMSIAAALPGILQQQVHLYVPEANQLRVEIDRYVEAERQIEAELARRQIRA